MARSRPRRNGVRYSRMNISAELAIHAMKGLLEARRAANLGRLRFLKTWTVLRRSLEATPEYQEWRRLVRERAGGACETCGEPGQQCHHLEPVAWNPDKALDPDNGRYLCIRCHKSAPEHKHTRRRPPHYDPRPRAPTPAQLTSRAALPEPTRKTISPRAGGVGGGA